MSVRELLIGGEGFIKNEKKEKKMIFLENLMVLRLIFFIAGIFA